MAGQADILLESGTNELEVLVFRLGETRYGVNVAKVREAIRPTELTLIPGSHPSVVGAFKLRDTVTTLIDLHLYFDLKGEPSPYESRRIIVMEFNHIRVAFLVDSVEQIYRLSWETVSPVPPVGATNTPVTSICTIRDNMVLMIDFERIVFDISGEDLFELGDSESYTPTARSDARILLAEDSSLMRELITKNLRRAGCPLVTTVEDGAAAWSLLQKQADGELEHPFSILITDIEMPKLDGLALTKNVKSTPQLANIPVVVFSSLVSPDNAKKIEQVKADGQITKPELGNLVGLIDRLLGIENPNEGGGTGPNSSPGASSPATVAREPAIA